MSYMSKKRVVALVDEMLDVMYQCSIPSISWYQICDERPVDFYSEHYLDQASCEAIYDSYRRMLPKMYRNGLAMDFINYAPTSVKKKHVAKTHSI